MLFSLISVEFSSHKSENHARKFLFMTISADKIINDLRKGQYKPVYWLDGEESFFIDQVIRFAEQELLPESEAGFNLTVFYGRDAAWADVVNACRRYPMFAEKQVVIIKEAQAMKDIDKLESYIEKPLASTLLFVAYKEKKVDGRTRLAKLLKDKTVHLSTKKMYENQLPEWTAELVSQKGYTINQKALMLLIDHIGNDLSRISNEIDKLALNLGQSKKITEDAIEQYIGVSKEFNVFELQDAIAHRNMAKAVRIIQYFAANPKAGPIQLVLPSLYSFFSKVPLVYTAGNNERAVQAAVGVSSFHVKNYLRAAQLYTPAQMDKVLLLLHQYNLRSVGIDDSGTPGAGLMKELVAKIMAA